tara:strand:- start:29 stop:214 length:186 start_codon:yes stop_codon:yes gene_type:complete
MALFFTNSTKVKKLKISQFFVFGKKSSIEKKPMVRSLRHGWKSPNLHYFHFSEDQIFDSSE